MQGFSLIVKKLAASEEVLHGKTFAEKYAVTSSIEKKKAKRSVSSALVHLWPQPFHRHMPVLNGWLFPHLRDTSFLPPSLPLMERRILESDNLSFHRFSFLTFLCILFRRLYFSGSRKLRKITWMNIWFDYSRNLFHKPDRVTVQNPF